MMSHGKLTAGWVEVRFCVALFHNLLSTCGGLVPLRLADARGGYHVFLQTPSFTEILLGCGALATPFPAIPVEKGYTQSCQRVSV